MQGIEERKDVTETPGPPGREPGRRMRPAPGAENNTNDEVPTGRRFEYVNES